MKRAFDLGTAILTLLILSPLMILLSIAIFLDSKGPIIFKQRRIGRNREIFRIYKFRTMIHRDADSIDHRSEKVVSESSDSRITRVGRMLRATSLDELPQLWNIVLGEMSIVGPRPIIPQQEPYIPPSYMKRFEVSPGLTGLAQVSGRRSLGWLEQLAYDFEYVERQSLWLDLKIICKTAWMVIARKGIYGSPGMNWRTYAEQLNGAKPKDQDVLDALTGKQKEN